MIKKPRGRRRKENNLQSKNTSNIIEEEEENKAHNDDIEDGEGDMKDDTDEKEGEQITKLYEKSIYDEESKISTLTEETCNSSCFRSHIR